MESARLASEEDRARVAELWEAARVEIATQRGGPQLLADVSDPVAGAPYDLLLVGCVDDTVVGFAAVDRHLGPVASVEAVYVEPGARAVGVGEAMMAAVLEWAAAQGCRGVDACALPGSRAAKAFFEDNGFVTRLLTMHRRLDDHGA